MSASVFFVILGPFHLAKSQKDDPHQYVDHVECRHPSFSIY